MAAGGNVLLPVAAARPARPRSRDRIIPRIVTKHIGRRTLLKGGLGLGIVLNLVPAGVLGQEDPAALRPKEGDLLVKDNDAAKTPLTPADLDVGAAQTMAWAMDPTDRTVRSGSRLNRVLLIRLDAATLNPETQARAADGVVAYTAICTHTGCEVVEWLASEGHPALPVSLLEVQAERRRPRRRRPGAAPAAGAAAGDRRRTARRRQAVHQPRRFRNRIDRRRSTLVQGVKGRGTHMKMLGAGGVVVVIALRVDHGARPGAAGRASGRRFHPSCRTTSRSRRSG